MAKEKPYVTKKESERVILVGVERQGSSWKIDQSLDELARLAETAGAVEVGRVKQRLNSIVPKTFVGSGKVEEIHHLAVALDAQAVIFDDELSPSQQGNLEKSFPKGVKVLDRTALILDIFGLHAKTREGKLQVQLAQLEYLYPRLRGMWSHLAKEQTRGGIGSRFGMGESQLEVDRRLVRNRISAIKRDLSGVETTRETQRKQRWESTMFRVSLAGYTNAGKSTLLNKLTDSDVYAQDQLFATLDPTTRVLDLQEGRKVALTDTVGFVQKLPTTLIEAFKSTLAEVVGAHLILKVVDATDLQKDEELETVDKILKSIGASKNKSLIVMNKCDLLTDIEMDALKKRYEGCVCVSSLDGSGVEELLQRIAVIAAQSDTHMTVSIPYSEGMLLKILHEKTQLLSEEYKENGVFATANVPVALVSKFRVFEISSETE